MWQQYPVSCVSTAGAIWQLPYLSDRSSADVRCACCVCASCDALKIFVNFTHFFKLIVYFELIVNKQQIWIGSLEVTMALWQGNKDCVVRGRRFSSRQKVKVYRTCNFVALMYWLSSIFGPWWWSRGQRACLLLWGSKFDSRWSRERFL